MSPAGRPEIGQPINIRLGDELLARVDAAATEWASSRADAIRRLLDYALTAEFDGGQAVVILSESGHVDDGECPCAEYGGCADAGGCEGKCGCDVGRE